MQNRLALHHETQQLAWRIDNWRRTHRPPATLPESLWSLAVGLAARQGVTQTSKALRLNRAELKAAVARLDQPEFESSSAAGFVELFGELGIELAVCESKSVSEQLVLQLESRSGGKMRIEATNVEPSLLIELVRAFAN
jgi:hypothetical protein